MNIGIFGGCFNPIHIGHISLIKEVVPNFNLDKILFIPNMNPYYKDQITVSFDLISNMIDIGLEKESINYEISNLESDSDKNHTTFETIKSLIESGIDDNLFLILGSDQFLQLPRWSNSELLKNLIDFIVVSRDPQLINVEEFVIKNKDSYKLEKVCGRVHQIKTQENKKLYFYNLENKFNISSSSIREMISSGKVIDAKKYLAPRVLDLILNKGLYI